MAKQRGPDGVPIDVPTHKPAGAGPPQATPAVGGGGGGDDPTAPPARRKGSSLFIDEPATRPAGSTRSQTGGGAAKPAAPAEPKTRIHGGAAPMAASAAPITDGMADPVVGWLVIIDGPGKGLYVRIGNGQNMIGRSPESRIRLDFGDDQVSRSNNAVITYDPRGRRFYIQQGSGTNLVYLNENPVLAPTELPDRAELLIGQTRLRFIAFCGPDFSWLDSAPPG